MPRRPDPKSIDGAAEVRRRMRLRRRRHRLVAPDPPPRYDAVYEEGLRWLNSLAFSDHWPDEDDPS